VRCDGTAALATCGSSERPILCEAALFVGDVSSTFSCNLALFVDIHAGKAAGCGASMLVSHRKLLLVEDQRRASWMVQKDKDRGASSASPARSVPLRRYQGVRDGRQRKSAILEYRFSASLPHIVLAEPTSKYFPRLQLERQVCTYALCRARRVCVKMLFTSMAPNHRFPMHMRILVYALSLVVASGAAYAQSDPLPKSAASTDVGARVAAMYSQCMQDWDSGTHLTKQEWERTYRRLMQERGKAALREGK
jgi:hypothetical protein